MTLRFPLVLLAVLSIGIMAGDDDPVERGRTIFQTGKSPSGNEIQAVMSAVGGSVPASLMPCAGCHGRDGRGRPEGGIIPSDIRWSMLTRPYQVESASGRTHAPYDEAKLKRAITMGLDASGNPLDKTMPRYQMSLDDMADLAAYIRVLGKISDPGITDDTIRLGVLLPHNADMANTVIETIKAYAGLMNDGGGLYGRRVDLRYVSMSPASGVNVSLVREFVENERPFALVASFIHGFERELGDYLEESAVPLIGAMTEMPELGDPPNRYIFYLYSGLSQQTRVLMRYLAREQPGPRRVAVIYQGESPMTDLVDVVEDESKRQGWGAPSRHLFGKAVLENEPQLKSANVVVMFSRKARDQRDLFSLFENLENKPVILMPAVFARNNALHGARGLRLLLSLPTGPEDVTDSGRGMLNSLHQRYQLPQNQAAMRQNVLSAARIFTEAVTLAGRELDHEKLIDQLETLYKFQSGFTRPVTFLPNRRVGARGAYILNVDASGNIYPVKGYVPLEREGF